MNIVTKFLAHIGAIIKKNRLNISENEYEVK